MLIGLLITLSLLLLLLSIPVTLIVHVSTPRDIHGDFEVCWLFGLIRKPVSFSQFKKASGQKRSRQNRIHRQLRQADEWRKRLSNRVVLNRLLRFANDFWKALHREDLRFKIRIGLGDPADTGILWGFVGPITAISNSREAVIYVEPEYFDTVLDIKGSGKIWFYPMQLVLLAIGLCFSMVVWRAQPLGSIESTP